MVYLGLIGIFFFADSFDDQVLVVFSLNVTGLIATVFAGYIITNFDI